MWYSGLNPGTENKGISGNTETLNKIWNFIYSVLMSVSLFGQVYHGEGC